MAVQRRLGEILLTLLIFLAFAATLAAFARPVLTGLLFALALEPLMRRWLVDRKLLGPRQASAVTTLAFCLFVLAPLTGIVIMLVRDAAIFARRVQEWLTGGGVGSLFDSVIGWLPIPIDRNELIQKGVALVEQVAAVLLRLAADFAGSLPIFVFHMVLLILTLYYGLADGRALLGKIRMHLPFDASTNDRILDTAEKTVRGGFLGAVLSAAAQAGVIWIGYLVLGVPNSTLAGVGTFFTSFVPILGTIPAAAGAILYLVVEGSIVKALIMGVFVVAAGTVDNIIKPYVLNDSVDLHPMLGLLSALGGLGLLGFIGIFVGPMFTALALEMLKIFEEEAPASASPPELTT